MVRLKRIISSALCVAVLFSALVMGGGRKPVVSVNAASTAEIQAQLDAAKQESNRIQSEISALEAANAPNEKQRAAIKKQITATVKEIDLLEEQIKACEAETAKLNKEIADLEAKCKNQAEEFKQRLVAIYTGRNSVISDLNFLMSSEDMGDYLSKSELLDTMTRRDNKLIEGLKADVDKIEGKKADIEINKVKLDEAKAEINKKKLELNKQYDKVNAIVMSYDEAIAQAERDAAEQKQRQKDLQKALEEAQLYEHGATGTGQFAWPLPGFYKVTSPFGYRWHPVTGEYKLHSGTDIAGAGCYGNPILAADSGVVILSKYYGGYGNCVMIDHGNGYVTLYGHMKAASPLKIGQAVYKGKTVVGYVGQSGTATGPHLHFEIIKNGEYLDPMKFF